MDNFVLDIEVRDDTLYIGSENCSGEEFQVTTLDDVMEFIRYYIKDNILYLDEEE